jgi:uncharacterized protein (TIGR02598 family)
MSCRSCSRTAFSLVEVTVALGIAGFCLIAVIGLIPTGLKTQQTSIDQGIANGIITQIIGDLRAAFRKPGNGNSSQFGVELKKFPPGQVQKYTPDPLYFAMDGTQENGPATAAFRATITYYSTSTTDVTTTLASITISWPATQSDLTKVAGSVQTLAVIDRKLP